jgi:penicillin-binding protein 2
MTLTQNPSVAEQQNVRTVGRQQYQSLAVMLAITLALLGGMGSRLVYLQLMEGGRNRQLAENNRIRLIPRQPERGKILDRQGRVLAGSRLSYAVFLWPIANSKQQWEPIAQQIAKILRVPADDISNRLEKAGYSSPLLVRVARGISPAQVTAIAEFGSELKGVQIEAEAVRDYPYGDLAAHVLGYTSELTDEELIHSEVSDGRLGDIVGQMGIEAAFEPQLRGGWGGQQVEVDSMGRVLQVLGEKPALAGNDVRLTLDLDIQRAAEAALGNRQGSIVAIDPHNGAVLAMVSRPAFDPNLFSTHITDAQRQQLQRKEFPFVNRALQGYPPASTYKIVTTTAAIESGQFSPKTVLSTHPYVTIGGIQFWDWNRAGFGSLGFTGALARNSDTFFYQTAIGMGEKPLVQWSRRFGFGRKTGIELGAEEAEGLVPDGNWKQTELNEGWYQTDTINLSIGRGYMKASPLQVAVMFAVVANGGYRVQPHLLLDDEAAQTWRESMGIPPKTIQLIQTGLRQVITNGTDEALNVTDLPPIAGKSGTAEDPSHPSHTWFGAYAPATNPEIVVVAFGENSGGDGSSVTAPMVRRVFESYFHDR